MKDEKTKSLDPNVLPENQPVVGDKDCDGGSPLELRDTERFGQVFIMGRCSHCERPIYNQRVNKNWVHGEPKIV